MASGAVLSAKEGDAGEDEAAGSGPPPVNGGSLSTAHEEALPPLRLSSIPLSRIVSAACRIRLIRNRLSSSARLQLPSLPPSSLSAAAAAAANTPPSLSTLDSRLEPTCPTVELFSAMS